MTTTQWLNQQLQVAQTLVEQASQLLRQNQGNVALQVFREADVILDMAEAEPDQSRDHEVQRDRLRAQLLNERGVLHQRAEDLQGALDYHRQATEYCEALLQRGVDDFRGNTAATQLNLSNIAAALDDLELAETAARRALELIEALREEETPNLAPLAMGAYNTMAMLAARQERFEEAEEHMEEVSDLARALIEDGQKNYAAQAAQVAQQLSVLLFRNEAFERALRWGEEARTFSEEAFEALGKDVLGIYVVSEINLISFHEKMNNFADAEDSLWKAIEVIGDDPRLLARGKEFYEFCRRLADPLLEKGGLPREEVTEGYREINEKIEAIGGLEQFFENQEGEGDAARLDLDLEEDDDIEDAEYEEYEDEDEDET